MTKEECLIKISLGKNGVERIAILDEYAKQEAIRFSQWMFEKIMVGYIGGTSIDPGNTWMVHGEEGRPMKTSDQLYSLYQQSKQQ